VKKNGLSKEKAVEKLTSLFTTKKRSAFQDDPKFDNIFSYFDSIRKNLDLHNGTLNEMSERLN
jgi:hypothetical protein